VNRQHLGTCGTSKNTTQLKQPDAYVMLFFSTSLVSDTLQSGKKKWFAQKTAPIIFMKIWAECKISEQIIWNLLESQSLSGCKSHAVGGW